MIHKTIEQKPVTTHPSRLRKGVLVDVVCTPTCKRYFAGPSGVGVADCVDGYLAYHAAGWRRIGHAKALRGAGACTVNGPEHTCSREHFLRILRGRA